MEPLIQQRPYYKFQPLETLLFFIQFPTGIITLKIHYDEQQQFSCEMKRMNIL